MKSYIKNSSQLLEKLQKLGSLRPNTWLFMADTDLMYINIVSLNFSDGLHLGAVNEAMVLVTKNTYLSWKTSSFYNY